MSKKTILSHLTLLGLGIVIGYFIFGLIPVGLNSFQQGILTGSSLIAIVALVVEIMPVILNYLKKKEEERLRQDKLILDDLKDWMSKTTFHQIKYDWVDIVSVDHKDPDSEDLPYFDKDKEVLKNYNALSLWTNGIETSRQLKEKGMEALKSFHVIIDKELENISLKRSLQIGTLSEPYYSVLRIRESIFEHINGSAINLSTSPPRTDLSYLTNGTVTLAWGEVSTINRLKKVIEDLTEDENIRSNIETYIDVKKKLDSGNAFSVFRKKIDEIFNDLKWNQKLKR